MRVLIKFLCLDKDVGISVRPTHREIHLTGVMIVQNFAKLNSQNLMCFQRESISIVHYVLLCIWSSAEVYVHCILLHFRSRRIPINDVASFSI